MSDCPSIKDLERLASGSLPPAEAESLQPHLESCTACKRQLEECRANADFFAKAKPVLVQAGAEASEETRDFTRPSPPRTPPGSSVVVIAPIPGIPGHEIIRELHRGGQGIVYEAVQQSTKRKVAVKVLLEGPYASSSARKRFEREVELVASLKHPNIIAIFQSGVTEAGHQFYVMDYIRGVPLHRYVHERRLPLREALKLFACVCDAVAHAHQHGVIHRDLKPSNILVDAAGDPKVLDFGLAKMVGGPEPTLVSMTGQVVGTLPYISPEQARGNPEEIDIRTDVYALGVILYQLLTGQYPYPVIGQLGEVLKHIAETAPTPPSKAWQADSGISAHGQRRQISRVSRTHCPIDHEVETIVLKALAKQRDRRYQSVGELGADVSRYLAGQPIEAKRDSSLYILGKVIRRHRGTAFTAAGFLLVLLAGCAIYAVQQTRLARQQAVLDTAEARAVLAAFSVDPIEAIPRLERATPRVREYVATAAGKNVDSPAASERVTTAPGAILVNPDAFWKSVDGGELWRNGEWLEVARVRWPDPDQVLAILRDRVPAGTNRQKYVAFCLIGQLAKPRPEVLDLCVKAVESEQHPGVTAAALWAADRMGKPIPPVAGNQLLLDDISGLRFVRIAATDAFRPGSSADDRDRYPDEPTREKAIAIDAFQLCATEVVLGAFAPFVNDPASADLFGPFAEDAAVDPSWRLAAEKIRHLLTSLAPADAAHTPVGYVSLTAARRYCTWLTARAKAAGIARTYRLPTEEEWEYACRGGNDGRFCYGNAAEYARYFADCEGNVRVHLSARCMPNFYGLFDMHGGLWELCDTRYPPDLVQEPGWKTRELFVKRGGAYYSPAVRCRSAQRNLTDATAAEQYTGLRVVLEFQKP